MSLAGSVKVRLTPELYDWVYQRSLGTRYGISGYLRALAEREMADSRAPSIVPEPEKVS